MSFSENVPYRAWYLRDKVLKGIVLKNVFQMFHLSVVKCFNNDL